MEGQTTYTSAPVQAAYSYCEAVTGQQARNFAYGIRLLPYEKRQAMSALYAFSRRVDDIGDGALEPETKRIRLEGTRELLDRIRNGAVDEDDTDPVAVALADAARRFPLPLGGLDELIDGVLMDVRGEQYETWDDLRTYCRCVAGAIGRLSLGVFGTEPGVPGADRAAEYADTLGLALQLTNILRDVREDAGNGRTYLPADDLAKFGCSAGFHRATPPPGSDFAGLVHYEVRRARALFAEGYPDARPAQRCLRGGHGRNLPTPPRPHRARPRGRTARPGLASRPREGLCRGTRPLGPRRPPHLAPDGQGARVMPGRTDLPDGGEERATPHPPRASLLTTTTTITTAPRKGDG